ncbi:MAG: prolyl oligopeptidase family serine peptidase [Kangiellaceae bacterium]|nr:prolyl oligopeptidase family serine peptidase [Kangiellaceae bacterium]
MARFLLAVIILFTSSSAYSQKLPVEAFYKNPDISSLRISPDGKHFAAIVEIKNDKKLAVLDAKTKKIKHIFSFSQGHREIGPIGWFNNERVYAEMVQKVGPLAQAARTGYLFAGNIDGSRKNQILPRPRSAGRTSELPKNFRIVNFLHDDPKYVLISMADGKFEKIYKLNIYTGAKTTFEKSPYKYSGLILDHNGIARAIEQDHPDDKKYRIYLRNAKTDAWELFKEFDTKKVGMSVTDISHDLKSLIINVRDKGKKRGLYRLDLSTKDFSLIKEIPGDASIEGHIYHYNKEMKVSELIGFRQMPGYIVDTYLSEEHPGAVIRESLKEAFANQIVDIVNTTRDGKKSLIRAWNDRNPGTYYLLDNETNNVEYLLDSIPWLNPEQLAPMEPIAFNARDGLEIRGYLTRPIGKKKDLPMIIYVHGGPYGPKDSWGYERDTQFLANRGYAVLQVNYRGSGGRGSAFQYDAYRQMGAEMQDDLTDATLWAVKEGIADKDRVCIYGASYGGYASMMGVVKEPDLYKCAVAYVGVYDIAIQTKESDTAEIKWGREFLEDAWNAYDKDFVRERSPIYHLDKLKAAVMLVHGKDDPRCPIEQYDALADALDERDYPYESVVKAFEGHGFRNEENNYDLYSKMEKFLEKHIGG